MKFYTILINEPRAEHENFLGVLLALVLVSGKFQQIVLYSAG